MIRTAVTTLALVAGLAAPAYAAPALVIDGVVSTEINHNGSVMVILQTETGFLEISYKTPRAGLVTAGVTRGTPLFEGAIVDGQIMGEAFAFKQGCRAAAYPVTGTLSDNGEIVLRGPGPRRSGCTVTYLDPASPHSVLEFDGDVVALQAVLFPEYIRDPNPAEIAGITGYVPPVVEYGEEPPEAVSPVIETPVAVTAPAPVIAAPAVIPSPAAAPVPVVEIVAPPAPAPVPTPPPVVAEPAPKPVPAPVAPKPPKPSLNIDF